MMRPRPSRGDVWLVDFNPVRGREQAGMRPALVVSTDGFNHGGAGLHVVVPVTRTFRGIRWHVEVQPPEGGLSDVSYVKCEDVRSLSAERFQRLWGSISERTMAEVERRLRILMQL